MSNSTTPKELFSVWGTIQLNEGKKKFSVKAPHYYQDRINRLNEGDVVLVTFSKKIPTRSQSQLAYYWVIVNYLSEYTGHTDMEIHDALVRLKFGTRRVKLGDMEVDVRRSISDAAKMSKEDMVYLIEFARETAEKMDIKIPSKSELGYLPN